MAFIPWPNGIQLCFDFTTAGQNWQFCLALRKSSGAPTDSDLLAVASEGTSWWQSTLGNNIENDTTLRQCRATDMTVEGGPQNIQTSGVAGAISGTFMPLNAASVVSLRTAKRGRSYRGRAYVSGSPASALISDVDISSTQAANLASAFTTLQSALDALGFDMVVASKRHNNVTTNPAELNEVIAILCDQHLDSQRRRLSGRGS